MSGAKIQQSTQQTSRWPWSSSKKEKNTQAPTNNTNIVAGTEIPQHAQSPRNTEQDKHIAKLKESEIRDQHARLPDQIKKQVNNVIKNENSQFDHINNTILMLDGNKNKFEKVAPYKSWGAWIAEFFKGLFCCFRNDTGAVEDDKATHPQSNKKLPSPPSSTASLGSRSRSQSPDSRASTEQPSSPNLSSASSSSSNPNLISDSDSDSDQNDQRAQPTAKHSTEKQNLNKGKKNLARTQDLEPKAAELEQAGKAFSQQPIVLQAQATNEKMRDYNSQKLGVVGSIWRWGVHSGNLFSTSKAEQK